MRVNILLDDANKAKQLLNGHANAEVRNDKLELTLQDLEELPAIIAQLVTHGIRLYEVQPQKTDLEQLFINLTEQ